MNLSPITMNLAALFATHAGFLAFCVEKFGRSADVYVDPPASAILDFECPYLALTPDTASSQEVSDSDDKAIRVLVVIDASLDNDGNPIDRATPTKNEQGFFVSGLGDTLATIVDNLTTLVANSANGAVYQGASVEYDNGSQYPLQTAVITFSFKTYQTF